MLLNITENTLLCDIFDNAQTQNITLNKLVIKAIKHNALSLVKQLISCGGECRELSLYYSIRNNNLEMAKYVVSCGAKCAKHALVYLDHKVDNLEMAKYLISLGAEFNIYTIEGVIYADNLKLLSYLFSIKIICNDCTIYCSQSMPVLIYLYIVGKRTNNKDLKYTFYTKTI